MNVRESKLFSDALQNTGLMKSFISSSMSEADAKQRVAQFQKLFSNYEEMKQVAKSFSDYADNPIKSTQYFNATVVGTARSFAGYLTIERAMDAANGLLYYLDLVGVTDGRKVLPNIGAEDRTDIKNRLSWNASLTTGTTTYTNLFATKLVPGAFSAVIETAAGKFNVTDDRNGNLLAPGGVLGNDSAINYATGSVTIELAAGFTFTTGNTIKATAFSNQTGVANVNRFKTEMNEFYLQTLPELLVGETNLASMAAMQKAVGVNPVDFITSKITELYTKITNDEIVGEITNHYQGSTTAIDVATPNYQDYRSKVDQFTAELTVVNAALATKSYKGAKATAYLVGQGMSTWFERTKMTGNWQPAETSYVNDLLGFYDGVPVLKHLDVPTNTGYAIHKTIDGNLAPVGRGIFLPITGTPTIGNYENPTQQATGVFYQQGTKSIVPELVQKFTIAE